MNLLYFNLCLDKEYAPLEFNIEWLNQIALSYKNVFVITKYNNNIKFKENIFVYPLLKHKEENPPKIFLLLRFYHHLFKILYSNKIKRCFSHMNPLYVVLSGLILRLIRVKIILWYTHPSVTFKLKLAYFLSNKIVSASNKSFRYKKDKLIVLGHFVDNKVFKFKPKIKKSNQIVYAGRISRIKNILYIIELFKSIEKKYSLKLILVGSCITKKDFEYKKEILEYIEKNNLTRKIKFIEFLKRDDLAIIFGKSKYFINATEKGSFDKVILEASLCGSICLISNTFLSRKFYGKNHNLTFSLNEDIKRAGKLITLDYKSRNKIIEKQLKIVKEKYSSQNLNKSLDRIFI